MTHSFRIAGIHEWSPRERRLLGMSGETPKFEPERDPRFTKEAEKQEETETVGIASLNGEDPRELNDMIQNAPQRIAAEREAYQLHTEVQSMEQNGFAQFLIGVDPKNTDQLNTYVTRRNAQLRAEKRPYTIGRTRDIISVHMKTQGQENPELTSLKARAAELDRQIGKMNGLRIRSEDKYKELTKKVNPPSRRPIRFKAPNEVTQVLRDEAKQRSLDDAKALSSLQKERADIARQIAMLDGAPYTPPERQEAQTEQIAEQSTEASSQPERVVVNTDTTQNILDPNAKLVIDRLPKDLQASVTRLYCSIPAEENRAALIQALNGFCELAEPVQKEVVDCLQTQSTEQPALAPEADTFLNGLPETAKKLLSDAVQEEKAIVGIETSDTAVKKQLDGILEKYRNAKTKEDLAMAEGSLRLMSVDIGKSNLETGDIKLLDKKDGSRPWQALFGIVQILGAVIAKAYGKEKPLEKKAAKAPTEKKEEAKKEEEGTTVEKKKEQKEEETKDPLQKEFEQIKVQAKAHSRVMMKQGVEEMKKSRPFNLSDHEYEESINEPVRLMDNFIEAISMEKSGNMYQMKIDLRTFQNAYSKESMSKMATEMNMTIANGFMTSEWMPEQQMRAEIQKQFGNLELIPSIPVTQKKDKWL